MEKLYNQWSKNLCILQKPCPFDMETGNLHQKQIGELPASLRALSLLQLARLSIEAREVVTAIQGLIMNTRGIL
jgi:hypothetical protein